MANVNNDVTVILSQEDKEIEKYNIGDKFYFDNATAADEWGETLNLLGYGICTEYDPYKINWIVTVIEAPRTGRTE